MRANLEFTPDSCRFYRETIIALDKFPSEVGMREEMQAVASHRVSAE